MATEQFPNSPEARFQFGGVTATVFANTAKRSDGSAFASRKTVLQLTYLDESGQFKSTSNLGVNDLPKAILALCKAYEHCLTAQRGQSSREQ